VHLEKLIQRLIAIINVQKLSKTIDVIILRIRNDLILKREQKSKLKIMVLQLKKNANKTRINDDIATITLHNYFINKTL